MSTVNPQSSGGLTSYGTGSSATGWWAIVLLILIESAVFAGLIASYFYLFANATAWPPDGMTPPDLMLPAIYSVILFASVIPMYLADHALAGGNVPRFRLWMAVGSAMLVIFLALKGYEYYNLPYRWDDTVYGSIVWLIAGFHSAHVLVVLLKALVQQVLGWKGFFNQHRRAGVQGTAIYWYFVVGAWAPLLVTTYLFPNFA